MNKSMEWLCKTRDISADLANKIKQSPNKLDVPLFQAFADDAQKTIECVETGEPFVTCWNCYAPEILTAMDLHWLDLSVYSISKDYDTHIKVLEEIDQTTIRKDICTSPKLMYHVVESGRTPLPKAFVALLMPCDSTSPMCDAMLTLKDWRNVPLFGVDPPYFEDERSIVYNADQIKRMVSFLERHTGKRLNINRLREVVEVTNAQYQLFMEYNELKRAVPCPHGSFSGGLLYMMVSQISTMVGNPKATEYFRSYVVDAEERVRAKKGAVKDERIRIYWMDMQIATGGGRLGSWLAKEWRANVILDYQNDSPYEIIDTSASEDSIFQGLAKRGMCHSVMHGKHRGRIDYNLEELVRIVKDYKMDCVFIPGHIGHKDVAGAVGLIKDVCRELGVPSLHIGMDVFDPRVTPLDVLKDKISNFFSTMGLG